MANKNKPRYGNWVKNFGESTKFAAAEVLSELAPSIKETVSTTSADFRELRQSIRDSRRSKSRIIQGLLGDKYDVITEYGGIGLKNLKQSLRTGKFYDKDREEALANKAMGLDMDDMFGGNDDFGDIDFGDSSDQDFGSVEMGPQKVINVLGPSNEAFGDLAAATIEGTEATLEGLKSIQASNKAQFSLSSLISQKYHGELMSALNQSNENLTNVIKFNNEATSPFVQGSLKYYDESLACLNSIKETLERIAPVKKQAISVTDQDTYSEIFSGGFNIGAYLKNVKKNVMSTELGMMTDMMGMFMDPMFLSEYAANPMGALLKFGIGYVIPTALSSTIKRVDRSFKSFVPALFTKISKMSSSPDSILSTIGDIFGVKQSTGYRSTDIGKYERGTISYDGESKKALVEVIPGYLARISYTLDAIAYKRHVKGVAAPVEMVYDWDAGSPTRGKFVSRKLIEDRDAKKVRDTKLSGFSDVRDEFSEVLSSVIGSRSSKRDILKNKLDELLIKIVENDSLKFNPNSKSDIETYFGKEYVDLLPLIFNAMGRGTLMDMVGVGKLESQSNLANYYSRSTRNIANTNNVLYNGLFNPVTENPYVRYYDSNSKLGISYGEDGKLNITREALKEYNKKYGTKFRKVEEVIAHYDATKSLEQIDKYDVAMKELSELSPEEKQKYVNSKYADATKWRREEDNSFSGKIAEMFKSPLKVINGFLDKVDRTLYRVIFGSGDDEESIFQSFINGIKNTFKTTQKFLTDKIFEPIKKALVGEDFKKTKLYQSLKEIFTLRFFGEKGKDGTYSGGVFSPFLNKGQELWEGLKKETSEWFVPKLKTFGSYVAQYLFGKSEKPECEENKKPLVDRIGSTFIKGLNQWARLIFGKNGTDKENAVTGEKTTEFFKNALPAGLRGAVAGAAVGTANFMGAFGVLGSLFMPGGPIGGAILGMTIGIVNQSRAFREFIFGKDESYTVTGKDENGNTTTTTKTRKVGGLISNRIQSWFSKHKVALVGGAGFGVLKTMFLGGGIGLFPSMAVGMLGPVFAGAAWGLAAKSRAFQRALFGEETKDGKQIGGLISRAMMKRFKAAVPRAFAGAGVMVAGNLALGQLGIIGSAVALGPMNAAIVGASLGLVTASQKFTRALFGYTDKNGKYHSGVMDKAKNWFAYEIFKPAQLYIRENIIKTSTWFKRNVAYPIADALFPIKLGFTKMFTSIGEYFKKKLNIVGDSIQVIVDTVTHALLKVTKTILKPLKTAAGKMLDAFLGITKTLVKFTVMPISIMGKLFAGGLKLGAYFKNVGAQKDYIKGAYGAGDYIGAVVGALRLGRSLVDTEWAYSKDKYASALQERKAKNATRDYLLEKHEEIYDRVLAERRKRMETEREEMRNRGYDLTDSQRAEIEARNSKEAKKNEVLKSASESQDPAVVVGYEQLNESVRQTSILEAIKNNTSLTPESPGGSSGGRSGSSGSSDNKDDKKDKKSEEASEIATNAANKVLQPLKTNIDLNMDPLKKKDDDAIRFREYEEQKKPMNKIFGLLGHIDENTARVATAADGKMPEKREGYSSRVWNTLKNSSKYVGGILRGVFAGAKTALTTAATLSTALNLYAFFTDKRAGDPNETVLDRILRSGEGANAIRTSPEAFKYFKQTKRGRAITDSINNGAADAISEFYNTTGDLVLEHSSEMQNTAGTITGESYNFGKKYGQKSVNYIKNVAEVERGAINASEHSAAIATRNAAEHNLTNAEQAAANAVDEGWARKLLRRACKFMTKRFMEFTHNTKVGKGLASTFKVIIEVFGKLIKEVTADKAVDFFIRCLKGAYGNIPQKGAGKVLRFFIPSTYAQAIFSAYDIYSGWTGAASVFSVPDNAVDYRMKFISTTVNFLFGLGWFALADFFLSIAFLGIVTLDFNSQTIADIINWATDGDTRNFNHRYIICKFIYDLVSSKEDSANLKAAQQKEQRLYQDFLNKHNMSSGVFSYNDYQEYKSGGSIFTAIRKLIFRTDPKWVEKGLPAYVPKEEDYTDDQRTTVTAKRDGNNYRKTISDAKEIAKEQQKHQDTIFGSGKVPGVFSGSGMGPTKKMQLDPEDSGMNYYYSQTDPRYGTMPVAPNADPGFGSFKDYGCAPTSLAMIASMYKGIPIDPTEAANFINKEDLSYGDGFFSNTMKGVKSSYFGHAAKAMGLDIVDSDSTVIDTPHAAHLLSNGNAMILGGTRSAFRSESETPFTLQGHYVVAAGLSPSNPNNVYIYDPLGRSGIYNLSSVLSDATGIGGYAAAFGNAGAGIDVRKSKTSVGKGNLKYLPADKVSGIRLYDLRKFGASFKLETTSVDYDRLTPKAKAALDYISKYFKYLTGRDLVVSSGFRTGNTYEHQTGFAFDVVDDGSHTTLEKNEDNIRTKMIAEASRVGIKVIDEYVTKTEFWTGGHLHMNASNWLATSYKYTDKSTNSKASGLSGTINGFIDMIKRSLKSVTEASLTGVQWDPSMMNDPSGQGPSPISNTGAADIGEITAAKKRVYRKLKDMGYDDAAIAGIMGNIQQESQFDPSDRSEYSAADGNIYGGAGIFQFNGARTQALKDFASSRGLNYQDLETQLMYFENEVSDSEPSGSVSKMNSHNDPVVAARYFADNYERCGVPGKRFEYAKEYYNRIMNGEFAGSGKMASNYFNNKAKKAQPVTETMLKDFSGAGKKKQEKSNEDKKAKKILEAEYKVAKGNIFAKHGISIDDYNEIKRQLNRCYDKYATSDPEKFKKQKAAILAAYGISIENWDAMNNEYYSLRKSDKFKSLGKHAVSKEGGLLGRITKHNLFNHSKAYNALQNLNKEETKAKAKVATPSGKDANKKAEPIAKDLSKAKAKGKTATPKTSSGPGVPSSFSSITSALGQMFGVGGPSPAATIAGELTKAPTAKPLSVSMTPPTKSNSDTELLMAVKALDTHSELAEMIKYLKAIAGYTSASASTDESKVTKTEVKTTKKKSSTKPAKSSLDMNTLNKLMDANSPIKDVSGNGMAMAYKIARGGSFRKE